MVARVTKVAKLGMLALPLKLTVRREAKVETLLALDLLFVLKVMVARVAKIIRVVPVLVLWLLVDLLPWLLVMVARVAKVRRVGNILCHYHYHHHPISVVVDLPVDRWHMLILVS